MSDQDEPIPHAADNDRDWRPSQDYDTVLNCGRRAIRHGHVADIDHHKAVTQFVKSRFGALDIYVANAGVINLAPTANVSVEDYDRHFAVNTRGVFFGVQAIMPIMRDAGSIIVTSSLAATRHSIRMRCTQGRKPRSPHLPETGRKNCSIAVSASMSLARDQ